MKILYLHQYFRTPEEGGAIRSYYLAKGLVEHGIEVELITSYNEPVAATRIIDGITVHYLPVKYDNSDGIFKRIYAFFKFMRLARKKASEINNVDLVYATSTPLTIGVSAMKIKKDRNIPYYFEVRDLWPEAPFQMGVIRNKLLKRYLKRLESKVYKNADKIIALSPGIRDGIADLRPESTISVIPNMSDIDFFKPEHKEPELEELFNTSNSFVISYFGAIGRANHLEYLLAAANTALRAGIQVKFFIIGEGSELSRLKYLTRQFGISNLHFLPFQSKYNLRRVLNVTDAAYVSFISKPIMETNSPNKFFDALAAGKLIITNTKGWVKNIVEEEGCGFYYDPDYPEQFVHRIEGYLDNKEALSMAQARARQVAEEKFARAVQVQKLVKLIG